MNDDQHKPQESGRGLAQLGRRRWAVITVAAVAAALVGTGAVIAVVNNLESREVGGDPGLGASLPAVEETQTATPTDAPTERTADPGEAAATPPPGAAGAPGPAAAPNAPEVAPPVEIDRPAVFEQRVVAEVTKIEAVQGEASGPGEIAGPALRVSITLKNETPRPVDLDTSVVALFFGSEETPAAELSGPEASPFSGRLGAGETASGVYVFSVPVDERGDVRITVSYSPTDTTVAFEGSAA